MKLSLRINELKGISISKNLFKLIIITAMILGGLLALLNWRQETEKLKISFHGLSFNLEGTFYGKEGGFNSPIGIDVGKDNEIYVADSGRHQIAVLNSKGEEVRRIGSPGTALGEISYPVSVIYDGEKPKARILVSELGNNRVQIFDLMGKSLGLFNFKGRKPLALTTINLDKQGNLYVVDKGSQEVLIYSPEGEFIRAIGDLPKEDLSFPMGIAIQGSKVYIADSGNATVKIFDNFGSLYKKIPTKQPSGLFSNPRGLTLDNMGNLYVTDALRNLIVVFDNRLQFIGTISTPESYSNMLMPDGVVWYKGNIYVIDKGNGRVVKYSVEKGLKLEF